MVFKRLICILAAASMACGGKRADGSPDGINYDGLRVKFGWSDALADTEYFFSIPRTIPAAELRSWQRVERMSDRLPELRMYCPPGSKIVCAYYDITGFVAGLQIAIPANAIESPVDLKGKFMGWKPKPDTGEAYVDTLHWTLPQFFVSEESQKAGAGPTLENGATLQDGGVWVYNLKGRLMRIPLTEAELNTTEFKKQNCIPNMGTHYYYNMTPEMKCEKNLPWFALTSQGQLIGTGFQIFGKLKAKKMPEHWFETIVNARQSAKITVPNGPSCLYNWAANHGIISLHIYYIDKPWEIQCSPGDSVKPAPAVDRFLLNGYRYASKITDYFKKIFTY